VDVYLIYKTETRTPGDEDVHADLSARGRKDDTQLSNVPLRPVVSFIIPERRQVQPLAWGHEAPSRDSL